MERLRLSLMAEGEAWQGVVDTARLEVLADKEMDAWWSSPGSGVDRRGATDSEDDGAQHQRHGASR